MEHSSTKSSCNVCEEVEEVRGEVHDEEDTEDEVCVDAEEVATAQDAAGGGGLETNANEDEGLVHEGPDRDDVQQGARGGGALAGNIGGPEEDAVVGLEAPAAVEGEMVQEAEGGIEEDLVAKPTSKVAESPTTGRARAS